MISDYDKYDLSVRESAVILGCGYAGIFAVCLLFYHSIMLSAAGGLMAVFLLEPACRAKARKRKELLVMQFRDMLYYLAASFAAGHQMQQALSEAYENMTLIYEKKTPLVMELGFIIHSLTVNRDSEEELLFDLAVRSRQEDIRNFVDVYRACRVTGGDMEKVIANASQVLMDKMAIDREIKALTAQKKFEGRIISVMPLAVVLFLNVFSPDYLSVMYETAGGRMIMTIALAGIACAYHMIMKMTEVGV